MPAQETCRTDELPHIQLKLIYADNSFFQVFPQTIIAGEAKEPLSVLNNMVLSESMAIRLFGDAENAIGKSVWTTIRNDLPPYVVTAVVKDPSPHTNLGFDALIYHDALKFFLQCRKKCSGRCLLWKFMPNSMFMQILGK